MTIALALDTTVLDADTEEVKAKMNSVVAAWKNNRREILLGLTALSSLMSVTTKIASKMADETGKALVKMLNSLLAVVSNTVSVLVATSAAYFATGLLAPVAAGLAAFAAGFSIGQNLAIAQTQAQVISEMLVVTERLDALEARARFIGQSGGF